MNEKEGKVTVQGGSIWYKIVGDKTEKAPLIVIHGGPGSSHEYLLCLDTLKYERQVVFYDQLGCGQSDHPDDESLWTLSRYVDELNQLIQHLGFDTVCLLGYSSGSMIALEYTLKYPGMVEKLILSSPVLSVSRWKIDTALRKRQLKRETQQAIERLENEGKTNSAEYQQAVNEYSQLFMCRLDPLPKVLVDVFNKRNYKIYECMWGTSEFNPIGNLKSFERIEQIKTIHCPIHFNCGEFDSVTEATLRLGLDNALYGEIHVFKNCAHLTPLEATEEYVAITRNFLRRCHT